MGAGQVEAEGLGTLHQLAQVGVAAEQVVDELASQGLLPADQLATRFGVALGERRHRVVHDLQHRGRRRPDRGVVAVPDDGGELGPHPAGRGQIQVDATTDGDSLLGGAAALRPRTASIWARPGNRPNVAASASIGR